MGKIINMSTVSKKEEKLQKIANNLKSLKNAFSEVIDEYENTNAEESQIDLLCEALDAMEDSYSIIYDVIVDSMLESQNADDDLDDKI